MDFTLLQAFTETSSEDEFSAGSSEEEPESSDTSWTSYTALMASQDLEGFGRKNQNIALKLINREKTGFLSSSRTGKGNQQAFLKIPERLSFCLKDIIPYCHQGHIFMGLTACGQFMLSYSVCCDDTTSPNNYSFNSYYKYTLYFWIYRPHQPLGKYYKICLFDDHGVDNIKRVTMTQWISHPRILIVHGGANYENEDSYISIIRVPRLGCLDCKELRAMDPDLRGDALCIKCNLTIHTKYSNSESDPIFNPIMNLVCPERIIIIANGFIHMLHVELEIQKQQQTGNAQQQTMQQAMSRAIVPLTEISCIQKHEKTAADLTSDDIKQSATTKSDSNCDSSKNSVVARILDDFSEYEIESQPVVDKICKWSEFKTKSFTEFKYSFGSKGSLSRSLSTATSKAASYSLSSHSSNSVNNNSSRNEDAQTEINLSGQQGRRRSQRIVTKSYRSEVSLPNTGNCSTDKASAYEFSEDNEKCEKIGLFRKRRLADKKYEFSEDNSENIVPFTKTRKATSSLLSRVPRSLPSSHCTSYSGPVLFASAQQSLETTNHLHRASPSQGFRSPCGSPVGSSRCIRSPSSRTNLFYPKSPPMLNFYSSNVQSANTKTVFNGRGATTVKRTFNEIGNTTPRSDEFSKPNDGCGAGSSPDLDEKPSCTKKFKRRYVEEDDAASVITSEEDDCISPGYHTSLPVEVHGSCYSDMQMISQISYQKLKCPTVIITQHSFDLETFTYNVVNNLCKANNKSYEIFYDWACELINVCPLSSSICCFLTARFTARDLVASNAKECVNCKGNLDCVFHRKLYECRILFEWNMETGDWNVLEHGELSEIPTLTFSRVGGLPKIVRELSADIIQKVNKIHNYDYNLRILTSDVNKSKNSLIDSQNLIQFYRKRTDWMNSLSLEGNENF